MNKVWCPRPVYRLGQAKVACLVQVQAISVIESIKLILRGVAFKMGVVLEVGVV